MHLDSLATRRPAELAPAALVCSECGNGNYFVPTPNSTDAACGACGRHVDTRHDIAPHLDADEYLTNEYAGPGAWIVVVNQYAEVDEDGDPYGIPTPVLVGQEA